MDENLKYNSEQRNEKLDEFCTPTGLIKRIVELIGRHTFTSREFAVLDPGANLGQWGTVLKEKYPQAWIEGVEILLDTPVNFSYNVWHEDNFLVDFQTNARYDLIIGNPPYSNQFGEDTKHTVAEDFINKSLSLLKPNGWLYFLLRSNIRHSRERLWADRHHRTEKGLHQRLHYFESWACSPRPSFYREDRRTEQFGTSCTNAHDYDLFVWTPLWAEPYGFSLELDWEYEENVDLLPLCARHFQGLHLPTLGLVTGTATSRTPYPPTRIEDRRIR